MRSIARLRKLVDCVRKLSGRSGSIGPTHPRRMVGHIWAIRLSMLLSGLLTLWLAMPLSGQVSQGSDAAVDAPRRTLAPALDDPLAAAKDLVERGRYPAAEAEVRSYLEDHPASGEAHFLLGLVLFRENKPKDSLAEYTEGAKSRKPSAADLDIVGLDYVLIDDFADAEKWLLQSTAWEPKNAAAWYSLGRVEYQLNHFDAAVKCFKNSLSLDPRSVKAENNLGLALAGLNRGDEAIAAYRQAIVWQAGSAHPSEQPLLNLGSILTDRNQLIEATQLLEQAATIAPDDPKIQEQLGRVNLLQNNLDAAAHHLERAVTLAPNDSRLHYQLGQVYQKQRLTDKAKAEFARTEALNGTRSTQP